MTERITPLIWLFVLAGSSIAYASSKDPVAALASILLMFGGGALIWGALAGVVMSLAKLRFGPWLFIALVFYVVSSLLLVATIRDSTLAVDLLPFVVFCGVFCVPTGLVVAQKMMSV